MIHLIGEDHYDIDASDRYTVALHRLQPDVITLEKTLEDFKVDKVKFSATLPYLGGDEDCQIAQNVREFLVRNPSYKKETADAILETSIAEVIAIENYTLKNPKVKVLPVDPDWVDESPITKKIVKHAENDYWMFEKSLQSLREMSEQEYDWNEDIKDLAGIEFYEKRDQYTADIIKQQKGTVVHMGAGLDHLFGNYNNLYEQLKEYGAIRYKLNEFE